MPQPPAAAPAARAADAEPALGSGVDLVTVRRMWPDLLDAVKGMRRHTWTLLSHNAQVAALDGRRLTLSLVNAGARDSFVGSGGDQIVHEALVAVLGVDWQVEAIVDPSTSPAPTRAQAPAPPARPPQSSGAGAARAAAAGVPTDAPAATGSGAEDVPSRDDPDADEGGLTHQDLLERELGAKVIGEYDAS